MRFDHQKVAGDGFMLNLNHVLLALCDPIITRNKKDVIDVKYFLKNSSPNKVNWDGVTRCKSYIDIYRYIFFLFFFLMSASPDDMKNIDNELIPSENYTFSFGTEVFWLTLESLHLGFSCVSEDLNNLKRFIDRLSRRAEMRNNPLLRMLQTQIDKTEDVFFGKYAHTFDPREVRKKKKDNNNNNNINTVYAITWKMLWILLRIFIGYSEQKGWKRAIVNYS
ncbi:hypothetical protein RFI_09585 [Reticulomyxa filosa]|uniref:Ubiquitin conjugation factor E4 core domain-containing protein n=1 Tax=Reticulomyxa filosa TaxID=46433 RepID=X6NQA2_RETFI|nr:hypothetical protein RFI_09585 [Reticulomyxa filosa]|eukprot:ETO27547.1 hypothetical protein RFI_09585 [Reticulomyxa filosa]